ncbi:hypothetical protein IQ260_18930 [Leptolyngbya cf. ectocarpi LEGE 11479]|uniref:Uncharacterized protein n=1 Tax=Leptolyngbya cf. ectocarpi LEGE 11479 TaxID=1828722 RepID=A0A928ZWG9_LEPEC|nr:hypothetical protein [Leptolyngbya ectocarpi]MBE9068725.1 hypothetical protein [Leptolyngbya cf. ectocarpi LEGE 11479]
MFKTPRLISLTLLTIGLLIGGLPESAEAVGNNQDRIGRKGGRATLGDSNLVDLTYSFSISDTTSDGAEITGLCDTEFSCLFENAVSDLTINSLTPIEGPINKVTIGTEAKLLDSKEEKKGDGYPPKVDFSSDLDFELNSNLNLRSQWDQSTNAMFYSLTDSHDKYEPIKLKTFRGMSAPVRTFTLGFELFREPSSSNNQVLDEKLVNNLVTDLAFILDTLESPSPKNSENSSKLLVNPPDPYKEFTLTTAAPGTASSLFSPDGTPIFGSFRFIEDISDDVDIDSVTVPESTSAVGLLIFTFLGIRFSKKKLL